MPYRSLHGVRILNLRKLFVCAEMPGGGEAEHSSSSSPDISGARSEALFALPPPTPLDINDSNAAENWKEFEQAWRNYSVAMKLHQEPETVQIATLLTVIGAEARKVFSTFTFGEGEERFPYNPIHLLCMQSY